MEEKGIMAQLHVFGVFINSYRKACLISKWQSQVVPKLFTFHAFYLLMYVYFVQEKHLRISS